MKIRRIETTTRFDRSFSKLTLEVQRQTLKRKTIFRENPFDPRLKTHKLKGKPKGLWSFSITHSIRVLFEFVNKNEVIFYDIGPHDIYRQKPSI